MTTEQAFQVLIALFLVCSVLVAGAIVTARGYINRIEEKFKLQHEHSNQLQKLEIRLQLAETTIRKLETTIEVNQAEIRHSLDSVKSSLVLIRYKLNLDGAPGKQLVEEE